MSKDLIFLISCSGVLLHYGVSPTFEGLIGKNVLKTTQLQWRVLVNDLGWENHKSYMQVIFQQFEPVKFPCVRDLNLH